LVKDLFKDVSFSFLIVAIIFIHPFIFKILLR
jgi:hypothetical protein